MLYSKSDTLHSAIWERYLVPCIPLNDNARRERLMSAYALAQRLILIQKAVHRHDCQM